MGIWQGAVFLEGHQAAHLSSFGGWAWGNIVFAGLIGLMVDAWTGGLYELSQDHVAGTFPASFEKKVETPTPTAMSSR